MRKIALFLIACMAPLPALADTVTSGASIDISSIVGGVENLVFAAVAAGLTWLLHRGVTAAETWIGAQGAATAEAALNTAITTALGLARSRLDAALRGRETIDVHNTLAAQAAQLVVSMAPTALDALGLTETDVRSRVLGLLGLDLSPIQTVVTPAPPPTDPTTEDTVRKVLAAIAAQQSAPPPAPAPAQGAPA